jgi:hypothetical protein
MSSFNRVSLRLYLWLNNSQLRKNDLIFYEISLVSLKIPSWLAADGRVKSYF